jgi:single-stranded-DNA-specific exonuclease
VSTFEPASVPREFTLEPYSYAEAVAIGRELGLAEAVAVALVRRGLRTPAAAREFLAADTRHDPSEFEGIDRAVEAIRSAIARRARITVHGDYDVDGVSATAILVAALRELGADCDWLIPARVEDGYGVTAATVERLAERGTGLVITVDCGITSAEEIAAARARGIEAVVTDHHQPAEALPECPIVHPAVSGYPCPDLCAAAVAHKLAAALLGAERAERDLDLVALATVADMVPLTGENRSLVRRGLELARRRARPGMRALMAAAQVVPERLDESDLSFRLAPRINASGRLYRADAAVELFLCADEARAGQIAAELDAANRERRQTESEVLAAAERSLRELGAEGAEAPAIVLWGEGWHPGVVGICASRIAERQLKPTVLIALDESGRGKGSGRSVPGFDLLAGLRACAGELIRYGGHRAAAGLEIERERLERFRAGFQAHAGRELEGRPPVRSETIDAVVGVEALGHEEAAQIAALGPFGKGNPEVRLLVPAGRIHDVRGMGEEERHARFSLISGRARALGVAFGVGRSLAGAAEDGPADVSVRLELNEWNGAVSPRIVLGAVYPLASGRRGDWGCDDDEYLERFEAELARPGERQPEPAAPLGAVRDRVDRTSASGIASVASLASSGEPVLVICADALWRRGLLEGAADPARFGGGEAALIASRGSLATGRRAAELVLGSGRGGIALVDWDALARTPDLARAFQHVVLADPAPDGRLEAIALAGPGYAHALDSAADPSLAIRALALALPGRDALGRVYRALAALRPVSSPAALRNALEAAAGDVHAPEWSARAIRVLSEIGVARTDGSGRARRLEVVSSVRGELERSPSYVANRKAHEECVRFLTRDQEQSSSPMPAAA